MHRLIILLFIILGFSACSSVEKIQGKTEDETYFLRGQAYFENESYDIAEENLLKVKNKYPYSRYIPDVDFLLAKSTYYKGKYEKSEQSFIMFADLHPKYKKIDEAKYLRAMSVFKQLSTSKDRDISLANKAIVAFREAMSSEYGLDALEKITEIKRLQAERILYIANFYKKRDNCVSAIERYQELMNKFDFKDLVEESKIGMKECKGALASAKSKDI